MEISTAIAAYTMRKDISEKVGYNMEMVLAEYDADSDSIATQAMDFLQARVRNAYLLLFYKCSVTNILCFLL